MARLDASLHESLTEEVLNRLSAKKIFNIIDFIDSETKTVSKITGLSYKEIVEVQKSIKSKYACKIVTGDKLYENFLKYGAILPTNIKSLDDLLGGGFMTGQMYEVCGAAGSGKTQMCLTICLNLAQHLRKTIVYIDTKRDFSAKRLQQMLEERNIPEDVHGQILDEIKVYRVSDRFEVMNVLHSIKNQIFAKEMDVKLIIIDSLPAVYYSPGDFNTILTHMNHLTNTLRYLIVKYNLCVLTTNVMLKNFNNEVGTVKVGLGQYWLNVPHVRLNIVKTGDGSDISSDCCVLAVSKSTAHKLGGGCTIRVGNGGCV